MSYLKTVNGKTIFVLAVDQWVFERDLERGFLGEAIAGKLIFPNVPLCCDKYLFKEEIALKKRLILELLENLAFDFPELANRIQILPQYFMYEVFFNRVRVFPLIAYDLGDLICNVQQNEEQTLNSYNQALKQLESEGKIAVNDGYVTFKKDFVNQSQNPRLKLINQSKHMPRAIFSSLFGVLPQLFSVVSRNTEEFIRTQKINWTTQPDPTCRFIDPHNYVFFPTSEGMVSLADKIGVKGFAKKMLPVGQNENIDVEHIGGMLNDVYLINAWGESGEVKVLAKRFKDWSGFKWFPLSVWSFGARPFAVAGQQRLAKECAISEFLRREGFNVPAIIHVSNAERLVFMEYIEAENLSKFIKHAATSHDPVVLEDLLEKVGRVGEIFAQVHSRNVTLGDTKPDNVLVKPDGTLFLIDFEQANEGGDKTWDLAVFLYYSGHYLQPSFSATKAKAVTKAFIAGYLKGGGKPMDVKKAGGPKYTRVFSIFTPPLIMRAISEACRKTSEREIHG